MSLILAQVPCDEHWLWQALGTRIARTYRSSWVRRTGKPSLPGGREGKADHVYEHVHVNVDVDVVVHALVDGCCLVRGFGYKAVNRSGS
jgi:hypothetical protein